MTESRFIELCSILDTLLGPNGCPWDKEQTLQSLKQYVLEETCELIDAINEENSEGMKEELGDLFFNVVFLAKVAAKEGHFTLEETLQTISEKLIRRHPHIFGSGPALDSAEEVLVQWQEIKKQEIKKQEKKAPQSAVDNIPKSLPALERARMLYKKMKKAGYTASLSQESLGEKLFMMAVDDNENAELELRKVCQEKENGFREWERCKQSGTSI
jgi:tetrapyrrole methylase family protein/MazG family protein